MQMQADAACCATLCMSVWASAAAHLVNLSPFSTPVQQGVSPGLCTSTTLHRATEQKAKCSKDNENMHPEHHRVISSTQIILEGMMHPLQGQSEASGAQNKTWQSSAPARWKMR